MSRGVAILTAGTLAVALATLAPVARAQDKATCKVLTIHATNKPGTSDPALDEIPELDKEPFKLYKTFHLLSEKVYDLVLDVPVKLSLPAGAGFSSKLVFKGTNKALKELNFKLYLIKDVGKGKKKEEKETSFAVKGEAPFFYVRDFKEGKLILYIKCGPFKSDDQEKKK